MTTPSVVLENCKHQTRPRPLRPEGFTECRTWRLVAALAGFRPRAASGGPAPALAATLALAAGLALAVALAVLAAALAAVGFAAACASDPRR
jgi:hypothetical protein